MNYFLEDKTHKQVTELSCRGTNAFDNGNPELAIKLWLQAIDLLPEPKENWEAATWLFTALGDCYFQQSDIERTIETLGVAVRCPGGLGNPFVHLRLGQAFFEQGDEWKAGDELARAYMGGGREIFEGEDLKYWNFIAAKLKVKEPLPDTDERKQSRG